MISVKKFHYTAFSEELIQKVWDRAQKIENKDPRIYRLDNCGALIKREHYLKKGYALSMGWEIDHIKPKSKNGTDELPNLQVLQWENKKAKAESFPFWKCIVSGEEDGNYYLK